MQEINDWVNQRIFVCFDDQIYKPLISDFFGFLNGPVMLQAIQAT